MILRPQIRRKIRRIRAASAHLLDRIAGTGNTMPAGTPDRSSRPFPDPVIRLFPPSGAGPDDKGRILSAQTESSLGSDHPGQPRFFFCPGEEDLPETAAEDLLIAAASLDLPFFRLEWPAPDTRTTWPILLSNPAVSPSSSLDSPGYLLRYPGVKGGSSSNSILVENGNTLGLGQGRGRITIHDPEKRLMNLPEIPGPPTVAFILPFLAVGGAEALLRDLLDGLNKRYRVLIVTLDQHREELGEQIETFRRKTPLLYLLGDFLPREARIPAMRHLLRRRQVKTLFSWNGTIDFYDHIEEIRRDFPELRIIDQHYNHEGAWLEWLDIGKLRAFNAHVGVNDTISRALKNRGAHPRKVHTIHHAVGIPPLEVVENKESRRKEMLKKLGIPDDMIVVGSFLRLHLQKRPLDFVRVAERLSGEPFFFLMVGGGPEEKRLRAAVADAGLSNFRLLPFTADTGPLFDATDLCLLLSDYEGLPVFLLEGMSRGIACAATSVGEIPELFSRGGGILTGNPGDIEGATRALQTLRSPRKRREMGLAGRETVVNRHSLDVYIKSYERLIFP